MRLKVIRGGSQLAILIVATACSDELEQLDVFDAAADSDADVVVRDAGVPLESKFDAGTADSGLSGRCEPHPDAGRTGQITELRNDPRCPAPASESTYVMTTGDRARAQCDEAYASMPPVSFAPPLRRWANLPRSRALLCSGKTLNINLLGDSIVADTNRGCWQDYLMEYAGVSVSKIVVFRGGTGPDWYADVDRPYCYAAQFKPDLLVLGGISQSNNEAAWRALIDKVLVESPATEILLLTGAFGVADPHDAMQWAYEPANDPMNGSDRLLRKRIAQEYGLGFFDLSAEWGKYIVDSGEQIDAWHRDEWHANARGEQILGRLLGAWLDPNCDDYCGDRLR